MSQRPAVFLDRDGTINEEGGYIDRRERITPYPWSGDAIRLLNRAGFAVVVVTNQAGVARGLFTEEALHDVHAYLSDLLARGGARVDAYYYCPHHPDGSVAQYAIECDCRKPRHGMIQRAVRELGLDPARSFMVGDRWLDVQVGRAAGARTALVRTGYGATEASRPPDGVSADFVADNLIEAVGWILRDSRARA